MPYDLNGPMAEGKRVDGILGAGRGREVSK